MQELINSYPNLVVRAGSVHDLVLDRSAETLQSNKWAAVSGVRLGEYSQSLAGRTS